MKLCQSWFTFGNILAVLTFAAAVMSLIISVLFFYLQVIHPHVTLKTTAPTIYLIPTPMKGNLK